MPKALLVFCCLLTIQITAWAETILQPADMEYDLAILRTSWERVHGGLYRYISPEELDVHFRRLREQARQPMPLRTFFLRLSQLNARLHCGHSFVSFYNNKKVIKAELYSRYFLPALFRVIDGRLIVTHSLCADARVRPGAEIVAVNGVPAQVILDSLLTVSKADGRNGRNKQFDNIKVSKRDIGLRDYCLFDIYFPLFFKPELNDSLFSLQLRNGETTEQLIVTGLTREARYEAYVARYGPLPAREETWRVQEIDARTVLFRLGDFTTYNWKFDFRKYLDSVFVSMNRRGYAHLIVDIRENEGGADEARDAVLSYLTPRSIGCANPVRRLYRYTSIPDSLHAYLDTWDETFKKPKEGYVAAGDGYYAAADPAGSCDTVYSNPNHFKGKIFLITDATNSSATFIMADCVKRNKLGVLVGETTGGTQQGINGGELFFLYLPRTQVEMDVPLIWQRPYEERPDEGIRPDYEVITRREDVAQGRDPQLEKILRELIQ